MRALGESTEPKLEWLISATFGIGGGAGLVLSGLIVDHLDYEWIFWLSAVFVVVAIVNHTNADKSQAALDFLVQWVYRNGASWVPPR